MKLLVTGGTGFIGSHTTVALLDRLAERLPRAVGAAIDGRARAAGDGGSGGEEEEEEASRPGEAHPRQSSFFRRRSRASTRSYSTATIS